MRHLDTFVVGRFRGIQNLRLEELGQINLLVGDNNSGKTSVLEALSLYSDPLNRRAWSEIANSREVSTGASLSNLPVMPLVDRLIWLFYQQEEHGTDDSSTLFLASPNFEPLREMSATYRTFLSIGHSRSGSLKEIEKEIEVEQIQIDVSVTTSLVGPTLYDLDENRQIQHVFPENKRFSRLLQNKKPVVIAAQLINPFSHRLSNLQPQFWTKVVEADLKDSTLNLLRSYDAKIQDIDLIFPDERRLVLSVKHQQLGRAPLSTFGDGLRRIFTLATAIPQCRNGLLLIDELETAIHTKALRRTFEWLVNACLQHNVQLFATTHSLETIDAVIDASKSEAVDLVGYRLERSEAQTGATRFDKGLLTRLREDLGMEIR
ncbi:MAG TPA: AAA family ATPase [Ktedonobacteraceae bacterium]|nr:AAA family ATPase [Ktedonobacteraceae bacterium]